MTISAKAQRLITLNAVKPAPRSKVYLVEGSLGTHHIVTVLISATSGQVLGVTCNCLAGKRAPSYLEVYCSHAQAARWKAEQEH